MPLSCAERQRRYHAKNRLQINAKANAFYHRNSARLRLKRMSPEARAKRNAYMRMYRLVSRILLELFTQRLRKAA